MRVICNDSAEACKNLRDARWFAPGVALLAVASIACGNDDVLILGDQIPRPYRFDAAQRLEELSIETRADNPTLTGDLLEIYFTTARGADHGEVWVATRTDKKATFGTPVLVSEVNSPSVETSPIVSQDGLTLWVGSDRAGGLGALDIWVSTRKARGTPWSMPTLLAALSASGNDIPRLPGQHGLVMPLASDRDTPGLYQIYFASRLQPSAAFIEPKLVPELMSADQSTVDGFLTDDGLTLIWDSGPEFGVADMYVAFRRAIDEPFDHKTPLSDLNTPSNERDPWLSADGKLLFFSSDRSGRYEIYVAAVHREAIALAL